MSSRAALLPVSRNSTRSAGNREGTEKKNTKQQPSVPIHCKGTAVSSLPSYQNVDHSQGAIQNCSCQFCMDEDFN